MNRLILYLLIFISIKAVAQDKLTTNKGIINFEASVPLFEEVKAVNEEANCILVTKTGEISCTVYIKRFKFQRSLMQEHFNENYLESDRYPKANFKGIIEKFDLKNLEASPVEYAINGKMTIHGKSKKITAYGTIRKLDRGIELKSSFALNTDDYGIRIPYIVRGKISKNVNTQIICVLQ